MKLILISLAVLLMSGCTQFKSTFAHTDKSAFSGSSVSYLSTALGNKSKVSESEFENRFQVSTKRASARLNIKQLHVVVRHDDISSDAVGVDDKTDSLLNTTRNWIGAGIHTNKGTYITYFRDVDSDFWMGDITTQNQIRPNLKLISGIYHLDHLGGTLFKSGGRRTTGLKVGMQYDFTPHIALKGVLEIGNNTSNSVEDRFLFGVVGTY